MPEAPPVVPRTPLAHHSYYKWLLHLEGISASSRLSQLFLTNSVVLLQQQPFIEYFYRSLRAWTHYVPFWNGSSPSGMGDVYGVVEALRRREAEQPETLQAIVRAAQGFATSEALRSDVPDD
ncbi:O-glucosyltransferase rumi [Tetrabaena socialis]|uniref:O-glucosyltransferase rumi n=1 Tax=Tetrabaena socialis TaxID=47790 RepID=A0A2J8A9P2_9CHLO|nr:O-glucosyltransferase rumi [Tetrabaena socialis]|eukprot:PNH09244.1 O-glucosyltransferase rumi [Tetrabaena socialis]